MAFLNILEGLMIFLIEKKLSGIHEYFETFSGIF